jgi:hypothetical protein
MLEIVAGSRPAASSRVIARRLGVIGARPIHLFRLMRSGPVLQVVGTVVALGIRYTGLA